MAKAYSRSQGKIIDVPDEQLQTNGMMGGMAGADDDKFKQAAMLDLFTTGGKNLSKIQAASEFIGGGKEEEELTASQQKRVNILNQSAPVLNRIISTAEKAPPGMRGTAGAFFGRIPGVAGGEAEFLSRDVEGFARLIASAFASEVGAATDKDIDRWKGILPKPGDTMNEKRRQSRKLIEQVIAESKALGIEVPTPIIEAAKLIPEDLEEQKKKLSERGFLEKLLSFEGTTQYIKEWPEIISGSLVGTGENIADFLKGDIESIKQRNIEYGPRIERTKELDEAAREEIATKVQTVAGLQMIKSWLGPKITQMFGPKAPQISEEMLKEGLKDLTRGSDMRNNAINLAEDAGKKFNGKVIYKAIKKWGDDAISANPNNKKSIEKVVKNAEKVYKPFLKDRMISPKQAFNIWQEAIKGYKESGGKAGGIESAIHRIVRDTLRSELKTIAPGFNEGTKLIHQGLNEEKILKSIRTSLLKSQIKTGLQSQPSQLGSMLAKTGAAVGATAGGVGGGAYLWNLLRGKGR